MHGPTGFVLWADKMHLELVDPEAFSRPEEKSHRYQSLVTYVRGECGYIFIDIIQKVSLFTPGSGRYIW